MAFWIVSAAALLWLVAMTRLPIPARWFGFAPAPVAAWLVAALLPLLAAAWMKRWRLVGRVPAAARAAAGARLRGGS